MRPHRHNNRNNEQPVPELPYSKERVEELKDLVSDFYLQGDKKRFAILVNGEMVVGATHDPASFDGYLRYLKPYTRTVEVRMYYGESPHFKRHMFRLQAESESTPLGYAPQTPDLVQNLEQRLTTALERQRLEHENQRLQEKCEEYQRKLKKAKKLLAESSGKADMKELIAQGINLYGQINGSGAGSALTPVQGLPTAEVEIEANDSDADKFYQFLKSQYGNEELEEALKLWELFIRHPALRSEFEQLITSKS